MAHYAIRIRRSYDSLISFCEYLNRVCDKWAVFEHPLDGNIHIHGLLLGCKVGTDTLKNNIKKALGLTTFPAADWSFKTSYKDSFTKQVFDITEESADRYITYCTKGIYTAKASKGFLPEYVEERRLAWVTPANNLKGLSPKDKVTYKLINETPAQKKKRKIDNLVDIEMIVSTEILEQRKIDIEWNPTPREKFRMFYKAFVKVMNDNHEFVTKYKFEEYYTTFLCRENLEPMESICSEVFRKLFSNGMV